MNSESRPSRKIGFWGLFSPCSTGTHFSFIHFQQILLWSFVWCMNHTLSNVPPNNYSSMKAVVLSLRHKAELIFSNSMATKNRPLSFKIVVVTLCMVDIAVMVYCMVNLAKWSILTSKNSCKDFGSLSLLSCYWSWFCWERRGGFNLRGKAYFFASKSLYPHAFNCLPGWHKYYRDGNMQGMVQPPSNFSQAGQLAS